MKSLSGPRTAPAPKWSRSRSSRAAAGASPTRSLTVDVDAARAILQFAKVTLGLVERGTSVADRLSCVVFMALPIRERVLRGAKLFLHLRAFRRRLLTVGGNPNAIGLALIRL